MLCEHICKQRVEKKHCILITNFDERTFVYYNLAFCAIFFRFLLGVKLQLKVAFILSGQSVVVLIRISNGGNGPKI